MTASPHQRISSAVFKANRQYMLALDGGVVYIVVDAERRIGVRSTLSVDQRPLAAEWVAEVANDIVSVLKGDPAEVYQIIITAL
jgi:hypothetical protein